MIHVGDCREVMASMEPDSFTAIVTDPPYGLSFMGKDWDHGVPGVPFWTEALRVLKPGGMLFAFGGTRTYHRLACAIEDAGFELRDCMAWLYGSGFPKSLDVSKSIDRHLGNKRDRVPASGGLNHNPRLNDDGWKGAGCSSATMDSARPASKEAQTWQGYGTALKPAWEPIIVAMKPTDGTFAQNALAHGVAGLNVDRGRLETGATVTRHTRKSAGTGAGWHPESTGETTKNGGRWPANVALDADAAAMLDEQSGDLQSGSLTPEQQARGGFAGAKVYGDAKRGGSGSYEANRGGASRFFYTSKASSADRHAEGEVENIHPTVKPTDLMQWLVRLVKMPEGTRILDPFCGSGSTLVAAAREGVEAVGIEISEEYAKLAAKRVVADAPLFNTCEVVRSTHAE